ncbi:MAG TPA: oxaloacetate decarboxylase [Acidimicrobiales bacterium]|nr:oxaloacetate decarboxylase [Acidimicrobiales bacterium]
MGADRTSLATLLAGEDAILVPGTPTALMARIAEHVGFRAVYLGGAALAQTMLAVPDVGLVTLTELVEAVERIVAAVDVPVIVDADTGFGGTGNVTRTVQLLERAGAAAVQIEDQTFPKRCGHFDDKAVVTREEMAERLLSAVWARQDDRLAIIARTDAAAVLGMDEAIARAHLMVDLGADLVFVEAPSSRSELERIGRDLSGVPLVVNQVEGGRTPLLPRGDLAAMGYRVILRPGFATRVAITAVERAFRLLAADADAEATAADVFPFGDLQELVGLDAFEHRERVLKAAAAAAAIGDRPANVAGE